MVHTFVIFTRLYSRKKEESGNMKREVLLSASDGKLESMKNLASVAYENGEYDEAFYWLLKCAKLGDGVSMLEVSKLYRLGIGVVLNIKKSNKWLKSAIKTKNAEAMVLYADNLVTGIGVEKNFKKALRFYKRAYKLGSDQACYSIGNCFLLGKGVKQNPSKAKEFFTQAAGQGNPFAFYELNSKQYS